MVSAHTCSPLGGTAHFTTSEFDCYFLVILSGMSGRERFSYPLAPPSAGQTAAEATPLKRETQMSSRGIFCFPIGGSRHSPFPPPLMTCGNRSCPQLTNQVLVEMPLQSGDPLLGRGCTKRPGLFLCPNRGSLSTG